MIRIILIVYGFLIFAFQSFGQEIRGFVVDSKSDLALEYVNIGVIDIPKGTITNETGEFVLDCEKLPTDCKIQISMIGYKTMTFDISELLIDCKTIKLERNAFELEEVTIKWQDLTKHVGTTKTSKMAGVCGWGGTDFGKGHEIGLSIDLGEKTVKVDDINLKIRKHSYDTVVFRLHIRSIQNGLPTDELLTHNIYLPITKSSGWQQIDLSMHNILISGNIALSIEWIKISNVIEKNLIKMNGSKTATPNVLFDLSNKEGTIFIRKGSANKWKIVENSSPGIFLTVRE